MCTLSWWSGSDGGYGVIFNRDELKSRPMAAPPRIGEREGVRFLAPVDTEAGGTWLLVNQCAVCLALLNWYDRDAAIPANQNGRIRSRGRLVTGLADAGSLSEVDRRLNTETELSRFRPFLLAGFERGSEGVAPKLWRWDGRESLARIDEPEMPVFSSGYDVSSVIQARQAAYDRIVGDDPAGAAALEAFHHDGAGGNNSAYTVRMNRPDAQTWSISRIRVFPGQVRFRYEAERPSLSGEPEITEVQMTIPPPR